MSMKTISLLVAAVAVAGTSVPSFAQQAPHHHRSTMVRAGDYARQCPSPFLREFFGLGGGCYEYREPAYVYNEPSYGYNSSAAVTITGLNGI